MPSSADSGPRAGRHAGGGRRFPDPVGKRAKDAARGGLFMGITLAAASVVSRFMFHRGLLGSQGWAALVAGIVSLVIAAVGIALTAILAASIVTPLCRPGGSDGRAAAG